jgi:hypothetical protein
MKKSILFTSAFLLLAACKGDVLADADRQTIQYQTGQDQFAIVIVQEDGMSDQAARELAMKKAAQLTLDKEYRYFILESQGQVMAMSPSGSNYQAPRNLYYELIQSGDFSRDQFSDSPANETQTYTGFRIMIRCYKQNPGSKGVDACTLVECKK